MTEPEQRVEPESPPPAPAPGPTALTQIRLRVIALKELREILRDRRTIITLVMMPLLVYPLLGVTFQKFLISSIRKSVAAEYQIGVATKLDKFQVQRAIRHAKQIIGPEEPKPKQDVLNDPLAALATPSDNVELNIIPMEDFGSEGQLQQLVADQMLDAAIIITPPSGKPPTRPVVEILYDRRSVRGREARDELVRYLNAIENQWIDRAWPHVGGMDVPAVVRNEHVASSLQSFSIVTFVPLVLVLMTITGAVYPAIDLTAGERERGTMEILVAAPVSRLALLLGKFFAVLVVAILTATVNLLGMTITIFTLGLEKMVFGEAGISFEITMQILIMLVVFAAFFSALMLGLTSFARSFKEAQAYLIPLMLVALAPGLLSLMPDLELTTTLAIVPLVNIVLSGRDLLLGNMVPTMFAITLISTCLYGLLALSVAARVFGTDSILYGSDSSWSDIFRRPLVPESAPTMSTAMLCLAFVFPAFIVIGGLSSRIGDTVGARLMANALVTILLFVSIPWFFARISNLQMRSTFYLTVPALLPLLGAIMLGCSVWMMAYELELATLPAQRIEALKELFRPLKFELAAVPLPFKLLALAVVPAVCEEFFFRGFLLSAFLRDSKPLSAIIGSAGMFGLFHVIVRDALLFERFLPSMMMGLIMGYICVRTGSLIPGMVLHALHNGLLVSLSHYEQKLLGYGIGMEARTHLPAHWLAGGISLITIGALIIVLSTRRKPESPPEASVATP